MGQYLAFKSDFRFGKRLGAKLNYSRVLRKLALNCTLILALFNGAYGAYGASQDAIASTENTVINKEYKLQVRFPEGVPVCLAESGEHAHGFYAWFDEDCHSQRWFGSKTSAISIEAYYNSNFIPSLKEYKKESCKNGSQVEKNIQDAIKNLKFNRHRSAACAIHNSDGSIDIFVVTQAGEWPRPHDSKEFNAPYINYSAALHTFPIRFEKDIEIFKMILQNIRIGY